jgi:intracellular sulfur oxidation DsrE/DsrF family protein
MKSSHLTRLARALCPVALAALSLTATADEKTPEWVAPVITGYGYINPLRDAKLQPDPSEQYKVVFDVSKGPESTGAVDGGLWHVARMVNLYARDGKAADNLEIAVVIHGSATRAVLDDTSYEARFAKKNPNADLIDKLNAAGVKLYVCGQAIVDSGYYYNHIRDGIEVVLGALAAEVKLATEGYVLVKL